MHGFIRHSPSRTTRWGLALTGLLIAFVIGCAGPVPATDNPFEIDAAEYDRIFQATITVLREQGYHVDRQDHRFGTITARPAVSPTLFEPWHDDNTTPAQAVQSTLNHERRLVRVTLEPSEQDPAAIYQLRVEVIIERQEVPTARVSGSTSGPSIITPLYNMPGELAARGIRESYWRSVSRDPYLEQRLIHRIIKQSMPSM